MAHISVIVPVYKVEPYLRRCVDSILAQTFADFELILVDDGSPDNCGVICAEYAQKDSRVHVIHQENGGLSAARNAGIDWVFANSDSEWLNFVDSDDWVHPQMLEQLYRAVIECDVKVSICGYQESSEEIRWTDANAVTVRLWPVEEYYVKHNINATVAWGKLYHRECFADIRYPVGKIHEDEYVTYRILFAYEQVAVIESLMYAYFVNPEGITKSKWTTKRLDGLCAHDEQIKFFKRNHHQDAYRMKVQSFVLYLHSQYCNANAIADKGIRKKTQRLLKNRLKRILVWNNTVYPIKLENIWIYEMAFPLEMRMYWYGKAILRRLKRK